MVLVIPAEKYKTLPCVSILGIGPGIGVWPSELGATDVEIADRADAVPGDLSMASGIGSSSGYILNSIGWTDWSKKCDRSIRDPSGCLVPLW